MLSLTLERRAFQSTAICLFDCCRYIAVVKALQNTKELEAALKILELSSEQHVKFARRLCLLARYASYELNVQ